jgi:multiple sugar transport system permease protein
VENPQPWDLNPYEQVLWGQIAATVIIAIVPQLLLSLAVQRRIVRGLTMGAVR